jgi:hypothetical protein
LSQQITHEPVDDREALDTMIGQDADAAGDDAGAADVDQALRQGVGQRPKARGLPGRQQDDSHRDQRVGATRAILSLWWR